MASEVRDNSHSTGYSLAYTYDHNANRLTKVVGTGGGAVTTTNTYGTHDQLLTSGSKSYGYDSNGNCTSVTVGTSVTTISYDYENRVTGITYPSSATNSFAYNGNDMRMQKVDSAGTANYLCDGTTPASAVLKDGSAIYTPGLSEHRGTTSKFYHADALGSTRGITNASQAVTDTVLYDGFGMTVSRTGTTPTPFGFVGKGQYQTDNDSGLQLLGHRYYDASVGRFISSDPIQDGDNWYAYCDNSPLKTTDPLGLKPPHDVAWHWVHDSDPDPPTKHQDDGRLKKIGQATWGFMSAVGSALAAFGEYASGQSGPMDGDIDRLGQGNEGAGNNSGWDPNRTHRDDLPKGKSGEPIADPNAQGPHTVIGTRTNPKESPAPYRQGVSYGPEGKPIGRTDVSNHGRPGDHSPVHFHPWNGRKFTNPSIPIQKNR